MKKTIVVLLALMLCVTALPAMTETTVTETQLDLNLVILNVYTNTL